jgi:hypothetical protein
VVGVLIGLAAANRTKTVTEAQRAGQPGVTRTITQTQPTVEVRTQTVTATTTAPSPATAENEARRREAERSLRTLEKENEELKRQLEGRP